MLIIVGIVVIGGLIAAYAVHWGPNSKAKKRTREYIGAMEMFVRDVHDKFLKNYASKIPASASTFKRYVDDIKNDALMVQNAMNRKMENAYKSDDLMHQVIRTLEKDAMGIIDERVERDMQGRITNEDLAKFNDRFTAKITEITGKVADIEKLLDTLRPQVGLRPVLENTGR
jgi:predicted transcriptional regulator